jgi:DNA-binding transcriptional LysR family regulator
MDVRQLEFFVAVADELNFTRAAQRVQAVQSTVSAGVRALERELRVDLFDRSTRHVTLTDAGTALLVEARAAIDAADRMRAYAGAPPEQLRGRVRVGLLTNMQALDAPAVLGEFRRRHPLVDMRLRFSPSGSVGLIEDIRRGRLDIAFAGRPEGEAPDLEAAQVAEFPFVAILPREHRLADAKSVALTSLLEEPFVDGLPGFGNRRLVDAALRRTGHSRQVSTETPDLALAPDLVAAGLGVAVLPAMAEVTDPRVVAVPVARPRLTLVVDAIRLRERRSPAVTALFDLVRERLGR